MQRRPIAGEREGVLVSRGSEQEQDYPIPRYPKQDAFLKVSLLTNKQKEIETNKSKVHVPNR